MPVPKKKKKTKKYHTVDKNRVNRKEEQVFQGGRKRKEEHSHSRTCRRMASLWYTLQEALHAPFISSWIIISTFLFVFTLFERINHVNYAINYQEIMASKQYYRLLTSGFLHPTPAHYFFMVTSLWSVRSLEWALGTTFFAKYTVILVLSESILVILLLNFMDRRSGSLDNTSDIISNNFHTAIYNVNIFGSTGTLLGWLAYASIPSAMDYYTDFFYFLGVIPVPWYDTSTLLNHALTHLLTTQPGLSRH